MADAAKHRHSDDESRHPPKPHLTLRVGISGHRPKPKTFPASAFERVQHQLSQVFKAIDFALVELKPALRDFYYAKKKRVSAGDETIEEISHKIRLVSGLAEGADQIAVKSRPPQWDVDAVLPFPKESYRRDFKQSAIDNHAEVSHGFDQALAHATTVVELPDDPRVEHGELTEAKDADQFWAVRKQGYARLGAFLLGQIDLLVAVWDGQREEGPGGTAEVVRGAINAGIPVVWISTVEDICPRMVRDIDDDAHPIAPPADALEGSLKAAISTIVSVPEATAYDDSNHHQPNAKTRLLDFFKETWPQPTRAITYDLFRRWANGIPRRWLITPETQESCLKSWDAFLHEMPTLKAISQKTETLRDHIREVLLRRYVWADSIAVERSNWYRSAYINCYLLAALLVAIALLGVFSHDWFHQQEAMLAYKAILVLAEFALIVWIVRIVRKGRSERWLEKWVEYRSLAELLRSTRYLTYVGEHGYIQRAQDLEPASSAWFLWYVRATIRELGLPSALLDATYQNKVLMAVERHAVDDQLAYNIPTAASLSRMHHVLHKGGNTCFIATGVILGAFLLAYAAYLAGGWFAGTSPSVLFGWSHDSTGVLEHATLRSDAAWFEKLGHVLIVLKSYVTFCAAFLPALGAALFGIRETGDFDSFSYRAARTADKLLEIKQALYRARRQLTLDSTTKVLLAIAQILTENIGAWQSVYGRKQLNLPA